MAYICLHAAERFGHPVVRDRGVGSGLDWVAKRRTCAMRLRIRRVMCHRTGSSVRSDSERLLCLSIGCGQARRPPVLPHRAAMNACPVTLPLVQHEGAARFRASVAISATIKRVAPSERRCHAGYRAAHTCRGQEHQIDARSEARSALAEHQGARCRVCGHHARRACSVVRCAWTLHPEGKGHAPTRNGVR